MWRVRVLLTGRRDDEDGFTLVELSVVLLVIAALIAMAYPAYAGARSRSAERAAQSNANYAFEAERILLVSTGEVSNDVAGTLPDTEPSIHWIADTVPTNAVRSTVAVSVGTTSATNDTVVLGVKANDGVCFYVRNYVGEAIQFATDRSCASATDALVNGATSPSGGWQPAW